WSSDVCSSDLVLFLVSSFTLSRAKSSDLLYFSGKTLSSDLEFLRGVIVDDLSPSSCFLFSSREEFFSDCLNKLPIFESTLFKIFLFVFDINMHLINYRYLLSLLEIKLLFPFIIYYLNYNNYLGKI